MTVYSQLGCISWRSAEVLMIFVLDFHLLNLSKTLGELGQQILICIFFWNLLTLVFKRKVKYYFFYSNSHCPPLSKTLLESWLATLGSLENWTCLCDIFVQFGILWKGMMQKNCTKTEFTSITNVAIILLKNNTKLGN